jgi:cell division cycle protein 20 (cofactor of APC complex)
MASSAVLTPVKSRSSVFSTRTAGGRMPLTPSPRTPRTQTPDAQAHESIHGGNFMSRLQRSISKTTRDSPKSNIARVNSPRRVDLSVSEWTLTGTGHTSTKTPKAKKDGAIRSRPTKTRIAYNAADRFIPNRTSSDAICNAGSGKLDLDECF